MVKPSDDNGQPGPNIPRRRFLGVAASVLGGLAFWRPTTAIASSVDDPRRYGATVVGFLRPTYLPAGWRSAAAFAGRPDGFGGSDEVALWYVTDEARGASRPLAIYQTRDPRKEFATTETHQAVTLPVAVGSGDSVAAQYHDGMWTLRADRATDLVWNTTDMQSLVFDRSGIRIGIRASRYAGIGLSDLLRVAASLS